jgi:MFS family permease
MTLPTSKKIPVTVVMLGLVSLFTDAATEMIYPLVPLYIAALGAGAVTLVVIEGVAETTAALLKLYSGILSDRIGKHKLLVLIGYSISTVARPFTGAVTTAWEIVVVRMFDRVGKGIRSAPRDALIASAVDESIRGKAYGFHRAMDHAGAVVGPLLAIGALLLAFGVLRSGNEVAALRWTFALSIVPGAFAVATIIFFVKEAAATGAKKAAFRFSLRDYDGNFKRYLFVLALFSLGNSSDAFLLFRADEAIRQSGALDGLLHRFGPVHDMLTRFGGAEKQSMLVELLFLPLLWSFFHVIKVAFATPFGALSDKIGRKATITAGWAIYAAVYCCFALLTFLPAGWRVEATLLLFAVYALYYSFTEGAEKALVADIVDDGRRGSAFGMYNFTLGISALPASVLFGAIYSFVNAKLPGWGGTAAFGFGAALAFAAMLLLAALVREPRRG